MYTIYAFETRLISKPRLTRSTRRAKRVGDDREEQQGKSYKKKKKKKEEEKGKKIFVNPGNNEARIILVTTSPEQWLLTREQFQRFPKLGVRVSGRAHAVG